MNIKFNYQVKNFRIRNSTIVKVWLKDVIAKEGFSCDKVYIIFVDDKYLKKINIEFLEHNYFTDIITFDYSVNNLVDGEIYISVETIINNAKVYNNSIRSELLRVMVHGILHLVGYSDNSNEDKERMRDRENYYLNYI